MKQVWAYLLGAIFVVNAGRAAAAQGEVYFGVNITINNYCAIVLQQPGEIATDPTLTQFSSKLAGGQSATARVYSLGNYDVTVDEVPFFLTQPAGGSVGTSWLATFSGQSVYRGRTFAERDGGNAIRLRSGYSITDLTVDLEVSRPDPFPAGDYTALTLVRCE